MNPVDVKRFYAHVLKGPTPDACWLRMGSISDDGYGRFWINTPVAVGELGDQLLHQSLVLGGEVGA